MNKRDDEILIARKFSAQIKSLAENIRSAVGQFNEVDLISAMQGIADDLDNAIYDSSIKSHKTWDEEIIAEQQELNELHEYSKFHKEMRCFHHSSQI